jgi:hypothetical protein
MFPSSIPNPTIVGERSINLDIDIDGITINDTDEQSLKTKTSEIGERSFKRKRSPSPEKSTESSNQAKAIATLQLQYAQLKSLFENHMSNIQQQLFNLTSAIGNQNNNSSTTLDRTDFPPLSSSSNQTSYPVAPNQQNNQQSTTTIISNTNPSQRASNRVSYASIIADKRAEVHDGYKTLWENSTVYAKQQSRPAPKPGPSRFQAEQDTSVRLKFVSGFKFMPVKQLKTILFNCRFLMSKIHSVSWIGSFMVEFLIDADYTDRFDKTIREAKVLTLHNNYDPTITRNMTQINSTYALEKCAKRFQRILQVNQSEVVQKFYKSFIELTPRMGGFIVPSNPNNLPPAPASKPVTPQTNNNQEPPVIQLETEQDPIVEQMETVEELPVEKPPKTRTPDQDSDIVDEDLFTQPDQMETDQTKPIQQSAMESGAENPIQYTIQGVAATRIGDTFTDANGKTYTLEELTRQSQEEFNHF